MKKNKCKKCVYYGGKRKGKIYCLNEICVRSDTKNIRKS